MPRRGLRRFWGDLEGKFEVLGKKVLCGDEMFQSLARKSEEIRASLLHFCTFADLTFRFSVRHGEVDPVRGSGFSKMQK